MNNPVAVKFLIRHAGAKLQMGERRPYSLIDEILAVWRGQRYVKRTGIARRAGTNDERMRAYYTRVGMRFERELREFVETASPLALEALASNYVAQLISGHLERIRCGTALRARWAQIGGSNTNTNDAMCRRSIHSLRTRKVNRKLTS
jgi:hypothetical protein